MNGRRISWISLSTMLPGSWEIFRGQNETMDSPQTVEHGDPPAIDMYVGNAPLAARPAMTTVPLRPVKVIGYVRVLMSPAPVLAEERDRLVFAGSVLALAAGVCIPLGIYLSGRSIRLPLCEI